MFWKRKKRYEDLFQKYQGLEAQKEVYLEFYEKVKNKDIDKEMDYAQSLLENNIKRAQTLIEICEKFCPNTGKSLQSYLQSYKEIPHHDFVKYRENQRMKNPILPEESLDYIVRSIIETSFDGLKIRNIMVHMVFNSIVEIIGSLDRPYALQKDDYLEKELNKIDRRLSQQYSSVWEILESENEERFRHSCLTLRELINNILNKKGVGKDQREKIDYILKNEDQKFAESFREYLMTLFSLLNKGVHKDLEIRDMTFTLTMVEDALLFLVSKQH